MPDLFTIAKNEARKVYKELNPSSLEEYAACLADAMGKAAPAFTEKQIEAQAKKTASWWWRNVFHKDDKTEAPDNRNSGRQLGQDGAKAFLRLISCFGGCILDTETTGLSKNDRIIELSIIDMEGNVLFSSMFNPEQALTPKITELTGITDAMLRGRPRFKDKADEISKILSHYILTGWNVSFDIRMLNQEFARTSVRFDDSNVHDLMELSALALGKEGKYLKLVKAKEELGIGDSQEHRSLADCMDTLAVVNAILGRSEKEPTQAELPFEPPQETQEEDDYVPF